MTADQTGAQPSPRLPGSRRARTVAGAVGLSLALLGAGIAAATGVWSGGASPAASVAPAENDAPEGQTAAETSGPITVPLAQVTNLTPYTWTLYHSPGALRKGVAPPDTLQPGQTGSWDGTGYPFPTYTLWIYLFRDSQGGLHQVNLDANADGTFGTNAFDVVNNTAVASTVFHMEGDGARHVNVVWNTSTVITIDGATDPASAAAAVNYLLPGAMGVKWTPKPGATPTFAWGPSTRATSLVYNYSSEPVTVVKGQETTKGQSTSIGEELSYSQSINVYGIVSKFAASFTSDQEWGSSDSVDVDVDSEVEPGDVGWINKRASVASLTGDLFFTTGEGISVFINNVTISKGDIINPAGGVPVGMDFTPEQQPATPAGP